MKIQTEEYITFIKKFTDDNNIMTKSFFIVISYDPAVIQGGALKLNKLLNRGEKESDIKQKMQNFEENRTQLEQRIGAVEQGLMRCGVRTIKLGTEEVIELFYKIFNPGETEKPIKLS
jgi:hypothetical protein